MPKIDIIAGFECAYVASASHDLQFSTGHYPQAYMREHYEQAFRMGIRSSRDGLSRRDPVGPRIQLTRQMKFQTIWDLAHHDALGFGAMRLLIDEIVQASVGWPMRFCPVNEPSMYPIVCGTSVADAVDLWRRTAEYITRNKPGSMLVTADPIYGAEEDYYATDTIVNFGGVSAVGINYYPEAAQVRMSLVDVIRKTWKRYNKTIIVTETSTLPVTQQAAWFYDAVAQCEQAADEGIPIGGLCWYPFVDSPDGRWPLGPHVPRGVVQTRGNDRSELLRIAIEDYIRS